MTSSASHAGSTTEPRSGSSGWPVTTWLEPHRDGLAEALDRLGEAAGQAFADAISNADYGIAERFAGAALDRNDPEEDRP